MRRREGYLEHDEAQAIAALDIRILNADRHEGNILIKWNTHGSAAMVPIDHGCSLRDIADAGYVDLVWFYWDEIKMVRFVSEPARVFYFESQFSHFRF